MAMQQEPIDWRYLPYIYIYIYKTNNFQAYFLGNSPIE